MKLICVCCTEFYLVLRPFFLGHSGVTEISTEIKEKIGNGGQKKKKEPTKENQQKMERKRVE